MLPSTEIPKSKTIGYWLTDKKTQKLNMNEFKKICKKKGFDLVKIDLTKSLENQGPFCLIFHKLSDIIVKANAGDVKSVQMMAELDRYIEMHPEVPVVDPPSHVRRLLDRYRCYLVIRDHPRLNVAGVFAPTSVELISADPAVNLAALRAAGVRFPFVCKPLVGHGSTAAHQMSLIFNEAGVKDCKPPAVAQTFINHNAVLYKIFCVGDQYVTVERPSLKNFYSFSENETIEFSSAGVSKSDSTSSLSALDADDPARNLTSAPIDPERLKAIVETVRDEIGLSLIGIDVVIENDTNRYGIIDLNSYPGYDGYPNFFDSFMTFLMDTMEKHSIRDRFEPHNAVGDKSEASSPNGVKFSGLSRSDQEDSGFDTCDSSDEKKKQMRNSAKVLCNTMDEPPLS